MALLPRARKALEDEFRKFLGPVGAAVFAKLENEGLERGKVLGFVDSLERDKVLSSPAAAQLKARASSLLRLED